MQIDHHRDDAAYRIEEAGERVAEMTYRREGLLIVILHTWVTDDQRGQGIAGKLVAACVADARSEGCRIQPVCAYAKRVLEQTPAYRDVLHS